VLRRSEIIKEEEFFLNPQPQTATMMTTTPMMPSLLVQVLSAFVLLLFVTVSTTTTTNNNNVNVVFVNGIEFDSPNWIIPTNFQPYPTMVVNVDDTLTFNWNSGTHDVWIHPTGTCNNAGAVNIGSSSGTTYTFTENDAGETLTFVCDIGSHCEAGMLMDVIVGDGVVDDDEGVEDDLVDDDGEVGLALATVEPTDEVSVPDAFPGDEIEDDEEDGEDEPTEDEQDSDGPPFAPCYVCGNEIDQVTNPTTIVQLPGGSQNPPNTLFPVSCQDLYDDGLVGDIPESSCPVITNLAIMPCGCIDPNSPNPVCNICGDPVDIGDGSGNLVDLIIQEPDNTVSIPTEEEPNFVCSELVESGLNNELTPTQCQTATLFAFTPCGCSINPADITFDECNICSNVGGNNSSSYEPLNRDTVLTLSQLDVVSTCGELYDLGKANGLGPARCRAATFRATQSCNCSSSSDLTTAEEETLEPSVDPSTAADDEIYVCNICGGGGESISISIIDESNIVYTMLNPENNFTDPNGLLINCGLLNDAGLAGGIITVDDCALISPLAQAASCGCTSSGGGTDEDTTDAPTDATVIGGLDGDTTPTPTTTGTAGPTTFLPTVLTVAGTTTAPVAVAVPGAPVPIPNTPFPVAVPTFEPTVSGGSVTAIGVEGAESTSLSSSSSKSLVLLIGFTLVVVTTLFL
jgi:plastocyanin